MPQALLGEISEAVVAAQTIEQLTRPLLAMLERITGLESTYLTRIDLQAGVQSILFARNSRNMQIPEGLTVPWEDTLCRRALEEGRFATEDVAACWGDSDAARALGIRTYVSMPVCLEDGTLFGTLCGASAESRPVSEAGHELLSLFGALIQHQIQREHLLQRLQEANRQLEAHSFTDPLTGLPNRRYVLQHLPGLFAQARESGRVVVLGFVDLDGFKPINDTYGHEAGDAFLVEVGRRLQQAMGERDLLGRIGGDEFVFATLCEADPAPAIAALRERLAACVTGRYRLGHHVLEYPGASFGIVGIDPHRFTPEQALRQADAAMYRDKAVRRPRSARAAHRFRAEQVHPGA